MPDVNPFVWLILFALGAAVVELYFRGHAVAYVLIFAAVVIFAEIIEFAEEPRPDAPDAEEVDEDA